MTAQTGKGPGNDPIPIANFEDIADRAGLAVTTVFGAVDTKKYIIETTGTGVAILDYDNDGWPDIFIVNGTTLEGSAARTAPTNHLKRKLIDEVRSGSSYISQNDLRIHFGLGSTTKVDSVEVHWAQRTCGIFCRLAC